MAARPAYRVPVRVVIAPTINGLTKPPIAPTLLMNAIPPALDRSDRYAAGMVQNTGKEDQAPVATTVKSPTVSARLLVSNSQKAQCEPCRANRKGVVPAPLEATVRTATERHHPDHRHRKRQCEEHPIQRRADAELLEQGGRPQGDGRRS